MISKLRSAGLSAVLGGVLGACTEPNPYLEDDDEVNDDGGPDSGVSTDPDTSKGSSESSADGTSGASDDRSTTGQDEDSSGPSTSTAGDTTGSPDTATETTGVFPAPVCPEETHQCVPAIEVPWQGPVARSRLAVGQSLPNCPSTYSFLAVSGLFSELNTPALEDACTCDCVVDQQPQCGAPAQVEVTAYGGVLCEGPPLVTTAQDRLVTSGNTCDTTPAGAGGSGAATRAWSVLLRQAGGTCQSNRRRVEATFGVQTRLCGMPELLPGCGDDEVCAPTPEAPFEARACVYRSGTGHACPPGYPIAEEIFASHTDLRECQGCTCSEIEVECGPVTLHGDAACGGGNVFGVSLPAQTLSSEGDLRSCTVVDGDVRGVDWSLSTTVLDASCNVATPASVREGSDNVFADEGGGAQTVCCTP